MLDVPALEAQSAGMQYTLRNVSKALDRALRARARAEGKSINEVALQALNRGIGLCEETTRQRDLRDIAGSWVEDPEFDSALSDQRRIDRDLWK